MTLLLVLAGVLLVLVAFDWARFEWTDEHATLTIETRMIREWTGKAVARGKQLLARFGGRHRSQSPAERGEPPASEADPGPSAAGHHT